MSPGSELADPWFMHGPRQSHHMLVVCVWSVELVRGAEGTIGRSGRRLAPSSLGHADPVCRSVSSPQADFSTRGDVLPGSWSLSLSHTLLGNPEPWEGSVHVWTPQASQARSLTLTAPEPHEPQACSLHVPKHSVTVRRPLCPLRMGACG